ncbi:MAG: TetR family transcriptional regulator C-terminal domain-containing protein, partial [Pseudomonadota bacterium]
MNRLSGQERRSQIVEGACAIILEKGLSGTATRDVTRHLGVGSGLLHHYFKTWGELRAEVVKTFIHQEIAALRQALSNCPTDRVFECFIDWMTSDPDLRFWKLWLDAIEEARRDPDLAAIVQDGHVQWHAAIVEMLERSSENGPLDNVHAQHAAWRVSALFDGLMGIMTIGRAPLTKEFVKELVSEQID